MKWDVDVVGGSVINNNNFISYHMIEQTQFDKNKYVGVVNKNSLNLINLETSNDSTIQTTLNNNSFTITDTKYIIAYKEHDYFDYFIYTSSLGGEVMITYDDVEGIYTKKATKLTEKDMYAALGWLLREGKINVVEEGKELFINLI